MALCYECPRKCGVDRMKQCGYCGVSGETIRIGRASLHMWEEPCISGKNGSGTIFFAGCNLRCVYCQNRSLSQNLSGVDVSSKHLAEVMIRLQNDGAHNINLVSPTHYTISIIEAIDFARKLGLSIPIVYNTSGYESVDTLRKLQGYVSVYLTDFKYADPQLGVRYSKVSDYPEIALKALDEMYRQVGDCKFDQDDILLSGVIVRHLVLPSQQKDSKKALKMLFERFEDHIFFSIMNQYTPMPNMPYPELKRKVTSDEYDEIVDYALRIGITNAFIQEEGTQEDSFIPNFDGEGVLK